MVFLRRHCHLTRRIMISCGEHREVEASLLWVDGYSSGTWLLGHMSVRQRYLGMHGGSCSTLLVPNSPSTSSYAPATQLL
jgi:hypothetical protein